MTAAELTDERVDAALRQVFDTPPFTHPPGGSAALRERAYESLLTWYEGFVGNLYVDNPTAFWLAVLSLSAVAALLLGHIFSSLWAVWRSLRRVRRRAAPAAEPSPGDAFGAARRALEAGEHRLAVELSWSAVVEASGALDPADTPRVLARRLRPGLEPERVRLLYRLLATHERACYAGVPAHRALAESAVRDAALLLHGGGACS